MRGGHGEVVEPPRLRRSVAGLLLLLLAALLTAAPQPSPAFADDSSDIASLVNQERWSRGMAGLIRNADLDAVAAGWAAQMAAANTLSHNPNTPSQIPAGWRSWGENVGQGYGSGSAMHTAWMNSEHHRDNVLGDFTDIGVAFVAAGGTWWGVEVFARYPGHAGPGAPPAAAAPAPVAPEPEPEPAPPAETQTAAPVPSPSPTPTPSAPPTPTPSPTISASSTPTPSASAAASAAPLAPPGSGVKPALVPTATVAAVGVGILVLLAGVLLLPASRRLLLVPFRRGPRRH
ncbi:CAP domain-containing protein [Naasia aerilata]|uniref:SCP domain-containing protein n=1 Tax=Naasia aerilata TaxID=1162966 RepID=A0ABM8GCN4_9MICO|nr:CAP domain-containing protein [Naasia aerilata]BDZ46008.1 hypothetical protein GCM10025866_19170 [Naasia aerilata]